MVAFDSGFNNLVLDFHQFHFICMYNSSFVYTKLIFRLNTNFFLPSVFYSDCEFLVFSKCVRGVCVYMCVSKGLGNSISTDLCFYLVPEVTCFGHSTFAVKILFKTDERNM